MRKFLNPYHFVPVAPKPMDPTADANAGVELPSELQSVGESSPICQPVPRARVGLWRAIGSLPRP